MKELKVNRKNIAWKSDREHKFGKAVYPFNFQNGTLVGGGKLDPHVPVSIKIYKCVTMLFRFSYLDFKKTMASD